MADHEVPQDERERGSAIDQLVERQVQAVPPSTVGGGGTILLLVLLCLILAGLGYGFYLFAVPSLPPAEPSVAREYRFPVPQRAESAAVAAQPDRTDAVATGSAVEQSVPPITEPLPVADAGESAAATSAARDCSVEIGPFISSANLEDAEALLKELGLQYEKRRGVGEVEMIRLLDGTYDSKTAHQRLETLQKRVPSAFILPYANGYAVYLASFHDRERAETMKQKLEKDGHKVNIVESKVMLKRILIVTTAMTKDDAQRLILKLRNAGIGAALVENR